MRLNKWWLGVAGGGILLVGLVVGALLSAGLPAWAAGALTAQSAASPSPSTRGQYCQAYLQALATDLHISESTLAQANQSALKATIQKAYQDGAITQAQETKLLNEVSSASGHPCAAFGVGRGLGGRFGPAAPQLGAARAAVLTAVAMKLGLTSTVLQSDLRAGQTVAQIAQTQHVALDGTNGLNAVYLAAVQQQLSQAVTSGKLTQAQSTSLYQMAQKGVQSSHYFLLDGGPRGHGPRGGGTPPQGQQPPTTQN